MPKPPYLCFRGHGRTVNYFPRHLKAIVFKCFSCCDVFNVLQLFGCDSPLTCVLISSTYVIHVHPSIFQYFSTVRAVNVSYEPEIFNSIFIGANVKCILTNSGKVIFLGVKSFEHFLQNKAAFMALVNP